MLFGCWFRVGLFVSVALATTAGGAEFVVESSLIGGSDAGPGDGTCADAEGRCSWPAAIEEANALPGADVIVLAAGPNAFLGFPFTIADDLTIRGVPGSELGCVVSGSGVSLTFEDVTANTAFVSLSDGTLVMRRSEFWGCEIALLRSTAAITDSSIGSGYMGRPGLTAADTDLLVSSSQLGNCWAGQPNEPAVSVERGLLTVRDSVVSGCSSSPPASPRTWGGGIRTTDAVVEVLRTRFTSLGLGGAALSTDGGALVRVVGCEVVDNWTTGLDLRAERIELLDTVIASNTSYSYGSLTWYPAGGRGARLRAPSVQVRACSIEDNFVLVDGQWVEGGAGLWIDSADGLVHSSRFIGNDARASYYTDTYIRTESRADGGGLFTRGSVRVEDCVFAENRATVGSGLAAVGTLTVEDSAFVDNVSNAPVDEVGRGGGLALLSGGATLVNSTLSQNVAAEGSELFVSAGEVSLRHVSVVPASSAVTVPLLVADGARVLARDSVLAAAGVPSCDGTVWTEGGLFVETPGACDLQGAPADLILGRAPPVGSPALEGCEPGPRPAARQPPDRRREPMSRRGRRCARSRPARRTATGRWGWGWHGLLRHRRDRGLPRCRRLGRRRRGRCLRSLSGAVRSGPERLRRRRDRRRLRRRRGGPRRLGSDRRPGVGPGDRRTARSPKSRPAGLGPPDPDRLRFRGPGRGTRVGLLPGRRPAGRGRRFVRSRLGGRRTGAALNRTPRSRA